MTSGIGLSSIVGFTSGIVLASGIGLFSGQFKMFGLDSVHDFGKFWAQFGDYYFS